MSVTTRINRAYNPSAAVDATNYGFVAGTGGTATGTRNAAAGFDGLAGLFRVAWTVATSAVSGGATYLQAGLAASTQYTHSMYVRSSKAQTVRLTAQYQTSGSVNTGTAVNSSATALAANTWTRISVTSTSTGTTDRVLLTMAAFTGGSNWANGDTLDIDGVLIEATGTLGNYFDGAYAAGLGHVYAWTGTANLSTSTDLLYAPVLTLVAKTDAPCARVEVTISDLAPTSHRINLWRTADGRRRRVRSYSNVEIIGSDFTTDYEAPLNRTITYEIEVLSGVGVGGPDGSGTITATTPDGCGYIQDPLAPETAIKVFAVAGPNGEPTLLPSAISKLSYELDGELIPILGSPEPVGLLGQRMRAANVPFDMFTDSAQQSTDLRNLLLNSAVVLIRPGADWGNSLPGLCYIAPPTVDELPIGITFGGAYCEWKFTASLMAPPEMSIVIPFWTYQDWQALWTTYQSAQTALSGKTYLAVRRSPANGV
jgi:hypothetical protein